MSARALTVILGSLLLTGWTVRALSQETGDDRAPEVSAADLEVTLEYVGGNVATYGEEIVRLELILDPGGRLDQVHLITHTGSEADTHIWYNMDNVVSVRYRFLEITGKGKVTVRTFTALPRAEPSAGATKKLHPLDAEDYR